MYFSKYNIFSKLRDSDSYFIVNILSGNADILNPEEAKKLIEGDCLNREEYIEKGYIADREKEEKLYRKAYLDFLDAIGESEIQIFYVPHYTCNFRCSYCYQGNYGPAGTENNENRLHAAEDTEVTDAFFRYIDTEFAGRKKYITVFGGEPLLPGMREKRKIAKILENSAERGLDVAIVTNGYNLEGYIPLLGTASIREIQVTLDGPEAVHDRRRPLASGGKSFEKIVRGIDAAMAEGYPINLRVVVDRENMGHLPELARFAIKKGWISNPLFKTQLGRNYELHTCHGGRGELLSRTEMYSGLYGLLQEHPEILEFHRPAFSVSRFLFDNGELPGPLFDSCPGCKTEWAFDYTGKIYSCTATVGRQGEELGTFYPEKHLDKEIVSQWEKRCVLSIPECRDCPVQLACGGGCASVAKNRTGKISSPDCRPVRELLEMGISYYMKLEE